MKNLILILVMMLFGFASLEAQNTGYVTVSWEPCSECCIGMEYYVCITVMRVSDRYVVVENLCEIVDGDQGHYDFEFEMPHARLMKISLFLPHYEPVVNQAHYVAMVKMMV